MRTGASLAAALLIIAMCAGGGSGGGGVMAAPPPPFSPTTGTVMDTVMTQPSWSLLATAINTQLPPETVSFLMRPPAGSGYTLFAPDNAAFEATALLLGLTGGGAELLAHPLLPAILEAQISTVTFTGMTYAAV